MSHRVVEGFEVVEVDEEDRPAVPVFAAHSHLPANLIEKPSPVGKPGQRIVECQALDLHFILLAQGDVGKIAVPDNAFFGGFGHGRDAQPLLRPVRRMDAEFAFPGGEPGA